LDCLNTLIGRIQIGILNDNILYKLLQLLQCSKRLVLDEIRPA